MLPVHTIPLPHLHSVAVALAIRGGPRYEGDAERGLTHFLEHMIFRGAGELTTLRDVMLAFEGIGGEPEAYTGEDAFVVQLSVDPTDLEAGLQLLARVLLEPRFADLSDERALILEERLERTDEDGQPVELDDLERALVFAGHPLGRSIIGRKRDILAVTPQALDAWRERIVCAGNAALVVAGPVDPERVRAAMAPLVLPAGPALADTAPLPVQDALRMSFQRSDGSPQTEARLSFRCPGESDPRFPVLSALADLLDGGPTGRLPECLVDSGLAYSARAELLNLPDVSLLELDVACAHDKLPRALEALLDMIAVLLADGVFPEELERGRLRRGHFRRQALDDATGRAEDAVRRLLFGLDPDPEPLLAAEDAVSAGTLVAFARELFAPEQLSAVFFGDLGKKRTRRVKAILEGWDP